MNLDDIIETFDLLDDWEERYRYVIELGRTLPPFSDSERNAENEVRGCVSKVWLVSHVSRDAAGEPRLDFEGDSDAHIVRGLVAIVLAAFSGHKAAEIVETDVEAVFTRLGLREHLTPQRSNGLSAMVRRIRQDAETALAAA